MNIIIQGKDIFYLYTIHKCHSPNMIIRYLGRGRNKREGKQPFDQIVSRGSIYQWLVVGSSVYYTHLNNKQQSFAILYYIWIHGIPSSSIAKIDLPLFHLYFRRFFQQNLQTIEYLSSKAAVWAAILPLSFQIAPICNRL